MYDQNIPPTKSKYLVLTYDYILPILLSLLVLFGGYLLLYSPMFHLQTITCELDFLPCENEALLAELDHLRGQNIFTFPKDELEAKLLSSDFTLATIQLARVLPNQLQVKLNSVYPSVALKVAGNSTWVVLDDRNRVIAHRDYDPNVPTLIINEPLTLVVGQAPDNSAIIHSLNLAKRLASEIPSTLSLALIDENTLELTLQDNIVAVFSPKKDELTQLRLLQSILAEDTIKKAGDIIDLRFTQPVLR